MQLKEKQSVEVRKLDLDKKYCKYMEEVMAYQHCETSHRDICHTPRCVYSVMKFKNNNSIYFTCGRENGGKEITCQ